MQQPLGKLVVVTPGTPVALATLLSAAGRPGQIHAIMFQALPTNTGVVYVGDQTMVASSYTGLFGIIGAPTAPNVFPSLSIAHTIAPNGLNTNTYFVDADQGGDGVIVTILQT